MNRALSPKAAHLMQAMETAAAPIALRFGQDVPVFSNEVAWDGRASTRVDVDQEARGGRT